MRMYSVLVTGSSSYGVGEGMIKTINMSIYRNNLRLIAASNSNLTAYKDSVDKYYILPSAKDENYLKKLNELIKLEKIDILIPGSEAEMEVLSKNKDSFKNVDIWVNDYSVIELFNDKSKANNFFKDNKMCIPYTYENIHDENIIYPLIIKPIQGKSSENIHVVRNKAQLEAVANLFKAYDEKFVVQEYIEGGEEYTISLVNLCENYKKTLIMKRILCKGATQYCYIEQDGKIEELILKINKLIEDKLIINIQLIKKGNKYYILEINPRFSGSAPIRAMLGYNEFDIIFSYKYLNSELKYNLLMDSYAIRGYKEFVFRENNFINKQI